MAALCGFVLHAQNTGISSGSVIIPNFHISVSVMSWIPMTLGSPMCTGALCNAGHRDEILAALTESCVHFRRRQEPNIGPRKGPASLQPILVVKTPICLCWIFAASNTHSKLKLHPIRKVARSSRHYFLISVGSPISLSCFKTRYRGKSVRRFASFATVLLGWELPGSVTST